MPDTAVDEGEPHRGGVQHRVVGREQATRRLDNYLASCWPGIPRSLVHRLIRTGQVRINGGRARAETRLAEGDRVRLPPVRTTASTADPTVSAASIAEFESSILLEDPRLLVVNKSSGMAVHSGSGVRVGLVDVARAARPAASRIDLVHRLDRETSGCLMLAKDLATLRALNAGLAARSFRKRYQALLVGHLAPQQIRVDAALDTAYRRDAERHAVVAEDGMEAQTTFSVLRRFDGWTLVMAEPATGRTHQIRVHARHLGHPLAGDIRYGDAVANRAARALGLQRLFLHAAQLEFELAGQRYKVRAELPAELASVLAKLMPGSGLEGTLTP